MVEILHVSRPLEPIITMVICRENYTIQLRMSAATDGTVFVAAYNRHFCRYNMHASGIFLATLV